MSYFIVGTKVKNYVSYTLFFFLGACANILCVFLFIFYPHDITIANRIRRLQLIPKQMLGDDRSGTLKIHVKSLSSLITVYFN